MLLQSLLNRPKNELRVLKEECSQFVSLASAPLYVQLRDSYPDIAKVKVRKKNTRTVIGEGFDKAFADFYNISQRCVYAKSSRAVFESVADKDIFYMFPIDGFRFLYNNQIEDNLKQHTETLSHLDECMESQQAIGTITEIIKATYTSINISEGINSGAEIMIYNIPRFYAVRADKYQYTELIQEISWQ
jgi:hypothetical protein